MKVASSLHSRANLKYRDWNKVDSTEIPALCNAYNCDCSSCKDVLKNTAHWTELKKNAHYKVHSNVRLGDRVIVQGKHTGVVRYIGDLDSSFTNDQIYIGVKMDDPVSESDGLFNGKRFFKCPPKHGLFAPINEVAYIPIPGKNYAKRLVGHHPTSSPILSNRCHEQRLLKQAEKLRPKPSDQSLKKSTIDGPSSNMMVEVCSSHQSLKSRKSTDDTVSGNQSFLSTDVEVSSVPANTPNVTPISSKMKYANSVLFRSRKCNSNKISNSCTKISQPSDAYVSSWMEYVTTIRSLPNTKRIFINSPHMREMDTNFYSETETIMKPKTSYTSRLLSGLPKEGMLESSDDSKLKDLEEFGYWMKHWGGGKKGWTMAQTRQKLKDAQRLGTKQTKWQQTIDELEDKEEFRPQIERIKFLQDELLQIRSAQQQIEQSHFTRYGSSSEKAIGYCQRQIKKEQKIIEELGSSITENPLASIIDMSQLMVLK